MAKVLVADDNADERLIFAALLRHHGHEVMTASDARSAIVAAREHKPSLILMDIHLPGMSGLQATEALRSIPETADIPVICVTAFDIHPRDARSAGCERFLRKPISPAELMSTVDLLLDGPHPNASPGS